VAFPDGLDQWRYIPEVRWNVWIQVLSGQQDIHHFLVPPCYCFKQSISGPAVMVFHRDLVVVHQQLNDLFMAFSGSASKRVSPVVI
jgi:hypothetical protein